MGEKLKAALKYRDQDFSVIPIRKDKKPYIKWEQYQKERPALNTIHEWWQHWPNANVAIVTGSISGVDVLDADSQKGHNALKEYLPKNLITPVSKTPKGWHYWFKHTEGLGNRGRVLEDVDIRAEGGYVIAPPSVIDGKHYTWLLGKSISEVEPASLPDAIANILFNAFNNKSVHTQNGTLPILRNVSFELGSRDETLFYLANHLLKGDMPLQNVEKFLLFYASHCDPPFPEKEAFTKIQSALKRVERHEKSLSQEVREWVSSTNGHFLSTDVHNGLQLSTRKEKKNCSTILARLMEEGIIERASKRHGCFRRIERECEEMDFLNAKTDILDLRLPFGIHEMVEIMPGNILLIAGEPNAGKTAFLLNIIKDNVHRFNIHYFNSEMGPGELRKRLAKFDDIDLNEWRFKAWERSDNFGDVVVPSKNSINIVDFLEIYENFYEVGGAIGADLQQTKRRYCNRGLAEKQRGGRRAWWISKLRETETCVSNEFWNPKDSKGQELENSG